MNAPDVFTHVRWAREQASQRRLTATQAHVLLLVATYADVDTGELFVSLDTLTVASSRSRGVVAQALRKLIELSLIERQRRGPGRAALTRLLTSDLPDHKTSDSQDVNTSGPPDVKPADVRPTGRKTSGPPDAEQPQEQPLKRVTPEIVALCELLAEHIRRRDPKAKVAPAGARWQNDMRLLVENDDRSVDDVRRIIAWAQADPFWATNILSPAALRRNFTRLYLKAGNGHVSNGHANAYSGDLSRFDHAGAR